MSRRSIYLDHRGNGRSDAGPQDSWTLAQWGDDVRAFCDALGIVNPIVLGVSFGGMVAIAYATRHPEHPVKAHSHQHRGGRAARIAIAASRCSKSSEARRSARWRAADSWRSERTRIKPRSRPGEDWPFRTTRARRAIRTSRSRTVMRPEVLQWFTRPGGEAYRFDMLADLGRIRCPTLVMGGEDDPMTTIECQADIAAALPRISSASNGLRVAATPSFRMRANVAWR